MVHPPGVEEALLREFFRLCGVSLLSSLPGELLCSIKHEDSDTVNLCANPGNHQEGIVDSQEMRPRVNVLYSVL